MQVSNSPLAEKVLRRHYNKLSERLIPKGREGAIQMAHVLRDGGHLAIMVDQKLNEGLDIPFFGKPAKTSTALASFALRHKCPVVPARVERLSGANFRVTFYPALQLPNSSATQADLVELLTHLIKVICLYHWRLKKFFNLMKFGGLLHHKILLKFLNQLHTTKELKTVKKLQDSVTQMKIKNSSNTNSFDINKLKEV